MRREFGDTSLGSIELFCLAADLESFTAAAQQAGLSPAAVSRAIGRLEERLGVRLFVRTTRKVRLTDGGREYHAHCKQALSQLMDAERQLTGHQAAPAGVVRISAPTTFGHHRLLPLLPAFRVLHPKVEVEVHLSNRNIDFTADGFDLAIRAREQADSGLIARKLMDAELTVVGTPQYLARVPPPVSPADLADHECIQFILPRTGQRVPWRLRFNGEEHDVQTAGNLTCSEDILGCATLARAGAGLAQTYRFIVENDIAQGTLVEVLKPFAGPSRPFSLIYPGHRHIPLRVRAMVDFLTSSLQRGGR
ncbi:MAG TPA: LysR family transcriptional regulator [Hydrogenophaga sp.]|nr:LysR family transcriptional regulator [Hydrogenophaga sp.]